MKRHGNRHRLRIDAVESMKNEADIPSSFEAAKTRLADHRHLAFIKLGSTNETPTLTWKKRANDPRRTHPPLNLVSGETMKRAIESISKITMDSSEFKCMLKSHSNVNNAKEGKNTRSRADEKEVLEDEEPSNKNKDSCIAEILKLTSEDERKSSAPAD